MRAPPVVVLMREPLEMFVIAKLEEVALPCTSKFPVVVALPEIVRPPD